MSNSQLSEIDASLQAIVRRAYDMGRTDALRKVMDTLNAEPSCSEQLTLAAPDKTGSEAETAGSTEAVSNPPWWAWRIR